MEELLVYALLLCEGYDCWKLYSEQLDKMFLELPENKEYLYLEGLKSQKEAVLHTISIMYSEPFDTDIFGRTLMKQVALIYYV